jgi:hypothetical protein
MTHLLPKLLALATVLTLLGTRWFHILVSTNKHPKPETALDKRRAELLAAHQHLFNATFYLGSKSIVSPAIVLLEEKQRDVLDAIQALERYGLPHEDSPLLTPKQNRILDKALVLSRDRAVLETLGAFDFPKESSRADCVPYEQWSKTYEGTGHVTRLSDSSLYDEVCTLCGCTDTSGRLSEPCPKAEAQLCTRQKPHVCAVNGPCNGFPRTEGLNPEMRLKTL